MSEPSSRPRDDKEEPFSLAPSIFLPFPGFSQKGKEGAPALEQTEKLEKIIENLRIQQDRVRGNMMFLVQQRAERLTAKAREEIAALGNEWEDEGEEEEWEIKQKSVDAMFAGLRVPAKKGTTSADFEYKVETIKPGTGGQTVSINAPRGDKDIAMGGMEFRPRTTSRSPPPETSYPSPHQLLSTLSMDLKELIDRGASEMAAYDAHARAVLAIPKAALDRRAGGGRKGYVPGASTSISPITVSGGGGGGVQSPGVIRRLSTGMPIPGFVQQPARVMETMEELSRRGSR